MKTIADLNIFKKLEKEWDKIMRIIKIFLHAYGTEKDILKTTLECINENKKEDDIIEVINLDTPDGYIQALNKDIMYYLPTIIIEEDEQEVACFEKFGESESEYLYKIKALIG